MSKDDDLATLPSRRFVRRRKKSAAPAEPRPPLGQGLLPIFDPLTVKELKGLSRHWQNHVGRVLYVGLVACVLLRWWSEMTSNPGRFTNSTLAVFGRSLFETFVPAQMALVLLTAVSAGSDMILKEVRSGTLGLLDMASLSAGQIAASKWKAVMVSATTLALCGLPVLAICLYLGGVGPWELAWSLTLTWTLAALGAACSIRYSAICHSPLTAILKSIGVILGSALVLLPALAFGEFVGFGAALAHPILAALMADLSRPGELPQFAWIGSLFTTLWVVARLLGSAGLLVRKRIQDPPPAPRPLNDPELFESNYRRLTLRGPRTLTVQRRIWDRHELLWKDWITRPATRLPWDARVALGAVVGFLIWVLWQASYRGWFLETFYVVGSALLVLATLNGAVLFGNEKDGMKIDMLLSTPLTSGRIIWTKLLAGLVAPESLTGIAFLLASVAGWFPLGGAGAAALASILFLLFAYVLGGAASLFTRTVRAAVLTSCGVIGVLVIGVPWIADTILPLGAGSALSLLAQVAGGIDILHVLQRCRPTPEQFATGIRIGPGEAFERVLPLCATYAGLLLLIVASIFYRFRRVTGRARG